METTGYSDLDEAMVLLSKVKENGRIAEVVSGQIRLLSGQHKDLNKFMKEQIVEFKRAQGEIKRLRQALAQIASRRGEGSVPDMSGKSHKYPRILGPNDMMEIAIEALAVREKAKGDANIGTGRQ